MEGGKYVSPEFRLGQVYDGEGEEINKEEEVRKWKWIDQFNS